MFSRVQKAVAKYQEGQTEEEEGLKKLETYVTDFSIVGGEDEGKSSLVKIINLNVEVLEKNIKAMLVIEGETSKIEYSIDNGKTWYTKQDNPASTEYTFENQEVGSYVVRVRVTDKEGKSIEAISDIVRVGMITTAEVGEVLEGETYITGEGKLETGEMTNNAAVDIELEPGEIKNIPQGYHNGSGTVTSKKVSEFPNLVTVADNKTIPAGVTRAYVLEVIYTTYNFGGIYFSGTPFVSSKKIAPDTVYTKSNVFSVGARFHELTLNGQQGVINVTFDSANNRYNNYTLLIPT